MSSSEILGMASRRGSIKRGLRDFAFFARRRPSVMFGLVIVGVTLFLALFGPAVAPFDPERGLTLGEWHATVPTPN